ncbi:hypothetical protein NLM33_26215 [Bradyrhizobium sp. CCGUVB1N3]|uniref:hypothetical protein n=1 Tax=Bradyrhizobium sp. CCGUVB1N3 TaxID=2949629 RepID=UPI0020B307A4|nr:hypothetical protein [Bradyrhizobium sp. CCGUVB1N3]MCP3473814.1 hypothetical protein [Bradyrhizobium sp. CCGUVB1N3]
MGLDPLIKMAKRLRETEMLQKLMHLVVHRRQTKPAWERGAQLRTLVLIKPNDIAIADQPPGEGCFKLFHQLQRHAFDSLADDGFCEGHAAFKRIDLSLMMLNDVPSKEICLLGDRQPHVEGNFHFRGQDGEQGR